MLLNETQISVKDRHLNQHISMAFSLFCQPHALQESLRPLRLQAVKRPGKQSIIAVPTI